MNRSTQLCHVPAITLTGEIAMAKGGNDRMLTCQQLLLTYWLAAILGITPVMVREALPSSHAHEATTTTNSPRILLNAAATRLELDRSIHRCMHSIYLTPIGM